MNYIKRKKMTLPRVWTSSTQNLLKWNYYSQSQEETTVLNLKKLVKCHLEPLPVTRVGPNGEWVPKTARKCIQRGKIILPSAVVCGLGLRCLSKKLNSWYFTYKTKNTYT